MIVQNIKFSIPNQVWLTYTFVDRVIVVWLMTVALWLIGYFLSAPTNELKVMPNPSRGPALGRTVDSVTVARTDPRGLECFLNFACAGWSNFDRRSEESEVFAAFASSKGFSNLALHHDDLVTLPSSQCFPPFVNNTWSMRNISPKSCSPAHSTRRRPPIICSSTNHPGAPRSRRSPTLTPIGVTLSWKWNFVNAWASSWRTTTVMIKLYNSVRRGRIVKSRYKRYWALGGQFLWRVRTACSPASTSVDKIWISFLFCASCFNTSPHVKLRSCCKSLEDLKVGQCERMYAKKWSSVGSIQMAFTSFAERRKNFFAISTYIARVDCDRSKCVRMSFKSEINPFALERSKAPLPLRNLNSDNSGCQKCETSDMSWFQTKNRTSLLPVVEAPVDLDFTANSILPLGPRKRRSVLHS